MQKVETNGETLDINGVIITPKTIEKLRQLSDPENNARIRRGLAEPFLRIGANEEAQKLIFDLEASTKMIEFAGSMCEFMELLEGLEQETDN